MTQPDDALNWDSGEAPDCEVEGGVSAPISTAGLRGRLTHDAPLAKLVWFKSGGHADLLAKGGLYARFWHRQSGGFIRTEAAE